MKRKLKAALFLSLLSPFFAEVLSGSTPPAEIINPFSFLTLWGFYGAGVLLVREFWVRYNKSVMGLAFLGFAYGILEEGVFVKSWFDPHWPDLGILGTYGRVFGVNAVWAVWLTIYHSLMSIWVPIMVFSLVYPDMHREKLFGAKGAYMLVSIYLFVGLLIYFVLNSYKPPLAQYIITIFLALFFIYFSARIKMPKKSFKHPFITGVSTAILLFVVYVWLPSTSIFYIVPIVLGIVIIFYFYSSQEGMVLTQQHALLLGFLAFWLIFYDFVLEFMGMVGELPLGFATYGILIYLYIKRYGISWKGGVRAWNKIK